MLKTRGQRTIPKRPLPGLWLDLLQSDHSCPRARRRRRSPWLCPKGQAPASLGLLRILTDPAGEAGTGRELKSTVK